MFVTLYVSFYYVFFCFTEVQQLQDYDQVTKEE